MNDTIETTAVAVRPEDGQAEVGKPVLLGKPKTAQEMRVLEVNEALLPAYQRASTLELSDEEIAAIMSPFGDEIIEVRPHDGLIYIPHIHISDRLNRVLKPGKWALVCRRHWLEGGTMYGEYVLLIRGCYVGESVGGHPYQPNNPKTNYSDTLESTAGEALRRIAAKRLSCGSQVWNPEYARQWTAKYAVKVNGKWEKRPVTSQQVVEPQQASAVNQQALTPAPTPKGVPGPIRVATEETRKWMIGKLEACITEATEYFRKAGMLLDTENMGDLPLRFVPVNKDQLLLLMNAIGRFAAGDPAGQAFPPNVEPESSKTPVKPVSEAELIEEWRNYPVPFGKHAGVMLGELEKATLFGFWANHEVTTEYNGKPKRPEQIAKDTKFREMLDQAGATYGFQKKD